MSTHQHPDHSAESKRIKRIIGQLEGVKRMIDDRRYCSDILNQTKAITSAIHSLEAALLKKHMAHCVSDALSSSDAQRDQKMQELLNLFHKRLK
jgi:DNA-binding FrmR family transcriptional regulator